MFAGLPIAARSFLCLSGLGSLCASPKVQVLDSRPVDLMLPQEGEGAVRAKWLEPPGEVPLPPATGARLFWDQVANPDKDLSCFCRTSNFK